MDSLISRCCRLFPVQGNPVSEVVENVLGILCWVTLWQPFQVLVFDRWRRRKPQRSTENRGDGDRGPGSLILRLKKIRLWFFSVSENKKYRDRARIAIRRGGKKSRQRGRPKPVNANDPLRYRTDDPSVEYSFPVSFPANLEPLCF